MGQCFTCIKRREHVDVSNISRQKEEATDIADLNSAVSNMSPQFVQDPIIVLANNCDTKNINNDDLNPTSSSDIFLKGHIKNSNIQNRVSQYSEPNQQSLTSCDSSDNSLDAKINRLFDKYKDSIEDAILADGIEKLCNDLELNPDEFRILVLAWKLNACQMCKFTRNEFTAGMKKMNIGSITDMKHKLTQISESLKSNPDSFKDLYRFTFKFGLDVASGQRILPVDIAILLWRLIFTNDEPLILNKWLTFLEKNPQIRGIPKDTWYMFLNFCEYVKDDLSSYDDTEAWPSLFDDFVEYENDQMNQNVSKNNIHLN